VNRHNQLATDARARWGKLGPVAKPAAVIDAAATAAAAIAVARRVLF